MIRRKLFLFFSFWFLFFASSTICHAGEEEESYQFSIRIPKEGRTFSCKVSDLSKPVLPTIASITKELGAVVTFHNGRVLTSATTFRELVENRGTALILLKKEPLTLQHECFWKRFSQTAHSHVFPKEGVQFFSIDKSLRVLLEKKKKESFEIQANPLVGEKIDSFSGGLPTTWENAAPSLSVESAGSEIDRKSDAELLRELREQLANWEDRKWLTIFGIQVQFLETTQGRMVRVATPGVNNECFLYSLGIPPEQHRYSAMSAILNHQRERSGSALFDVRDQKALQAMSNALAAKIVVLPKLSSVVTHEGETLHYSIGFGAFEVTPEQETTRKTRFVFGQPGHFEALIPAGDTDGLLTQLMIADYYNSPFLLGGEVPPASSEQKISEYRFHVDTREELIQQMEWLGSRLRSFLPNQLSSGELEELEQQAVVARNDYGITAAIQVLEQVQRLKG